MKKTLVALAAVAATSAAFAEVKISGFIDQAYNRTTLNGATTTSIGSNIIGQDQITFGVSEDLGNGITAYGNIRVIPNVSEGAVFANDNSEVGIKGAFGNVAMGNQYSTMWGNLAAADATGFGGSIGNVHSSIQHFTVGKRNDVISYSLPTIVEGLSVSVEKANGGASTGVGDGTGYSIGYTIGGLKVNAAGIKARVSAAIDAMENGSAAITPTSGSTTQTSGLAASYDLGLAAIYFGSANSKNSTDADIKIATSMYGVSVPFGAITFGLGMSSSSVTKADTSTVKETGTRMVVKYALSKRTTAYIVNGRSKDNGTAVSSQTGLGVTHNF